MQQSKKRKKTYQNPKTFLDFEKKRSVKNVKTVKVIRHVKL